MEMDFSEPNERILRAFRADKMAKTENSQYSRYAMRIERTHFETDVIILRAGDGYRPRFAECRNLLASNNLQIILR